MPELPAGWLVDEEARELARVAQGKTVLELGAWKGRSTTVLSKAAKYVVSVDRHQGIAEVGGDDSLPDYLDAVRRLPNVAIVVASFERFVPLLGRSFDVVFVDGNHDADSVHRDTSLAFSHVADDGIVAFHDWDFDTVRDGVSRYLGPVAPNMLRGSLAVFYVESVR